MTSHRYGDAQSRTVLGYTSNQFAGDALPVLGEWHHRLQFYFRRTSGSHVLVAGVDIVYVVVGDATTASGACWPATEHIANRRSKGFAMLNVSSSRVRRMLCIGYKPWSGQLGMIGGKGWLRGSDVLYSFCEKQALNNQDPANETDGSTTSPSASKRTRAVSRGEDTMFWLFWSRAARNGEDRRAGHEGHG